jgi:hypothetical protein
MKKKNNTYYFAAWTDSECLFGCEHCHSTVLSAVACTTPDAGGYVVAVENGKLRALNEAEEVEFQRYKYGIEPAAKESVAPSLLVQLMLRPDPK